MKTSDVPLDLLPPRVPNHVRSNTESRVTYQNFTFEDEFFDSIIPHNSDARQADRDDWPPRFLFDVAYGCTAMRTWGASEFVKFATDHAKEYYYHDEDYKDDGHNDNHDNDDQTTIRAKEMPVTRQAKAGDGQVLDVFDMVLGLWAYGSRKDLCRARKMEKERMRESVQKWRQAVS